MKLVNLDPDSCDMRILACENGTAKVEVPRKELGMLYMRLMQGSVESLPVPVLRLSSIWSNSNQCLLFSALTYV